MIQQLVTIIMCHLFGDYVLQTDFIARTKGASWYHMIVHCLLYTLPFMACLGFDWRLAVIFGSHLVIDAFKARWGVISYSADQVFHYMTAVTLYLTK